MKRKPLYRRLWNKLSNLTASRTSKCGDLLPEDVLDTARRLEFCDHGCPLPCPDCGCGT